MVDPIGIKTGAVASQRTVSVVATQAAAAPKAVQGTAKDAKPVETEAAELAGAMASEAPVDAERVSRIKKAIEDGKFPTVPSTIADRLLALKLQWNPNDPA
ncbi:MAG: flagellar biosynthesis anti-sigma factor FlgM [Sphingomonas sp.]|nr:flagellar biosynthesis anti-sigma factor FlgM [Sphingomonas sp.]